MTAEIVNLRRARKQKAHTEKEREAEAKRLAFGRTKAERKASRAEAERAGRAIDSHRREPRDE